MSDDLFSTDEAARRLGICRASLYAWIGQSDLGNLVIRGQSITIEYLQSGPKGQGRIKIEAAEIERLKDAMRARPRSDRRRPSPTRRQHYPGITVKLGRPDDRV